MKIDKTNFDVEKRDFYNKVRDRKEELTKVLYAANLDGVGFKDFNEWYTQEYDWRFLRDILGERDKKGLPWDYNTLIHLPVITWTDGEGEKQRTILKGEVTPDDLGFNITEMEAGDGIEITKSENEDEHIVFTVTNTTEVGTGDVPTSVETASYIKVKGTVYALPGASSTAADKTWVTQQIDANMMKPSTVMFEGATAPVAYTIGDTQYNFPTPDIDESMSDTSENAVKNKVIKAYIDDADSKKVNKITTTGYGAYGHSDGAEKDWTISANADEKTLAYRTTDGRLRVGTPEEETDAINKDYLETKYYNKDTVDYKIATETGLYIGYMEDSTITTESEFAPNTWIPNNWTTFFPSKEISSVSNNDYVWVFLTSLVDEEGNTYEGYYRCKMTVDTSTEPETREWKIDLTAYSYDLQLLDEIKQIKTNIANIINGTTPFTGDVTIEKETAELKLNSTGTNDLSAVSFLENGTEKRNLIYDNTDSADKLYFTDGTNELVVPNKAGTIAIDDSVVHLTGEETISGHKTFTGSIDDAPTSAGVQIGVGGNNDYAIAELHSDNGCYIDMGTLNNNYKYRLGLISNKASIELEDTDGSRSIYFPTSSGRLSKQLYRHYIQIGFSGQSFTYQSGNTATWSSGYLTIVVINDSSTELTSLSSILANNVVSLFGYSSWSLSQGGTIILPWMYIDSNHAYALSIASGLLFTGITCTPQSITDNVTSL